MMMLAKAQIQLGDLEKAVSALLKLTIEYPTSIEAGEATYLMGYCYMLQNEFESAKAAFNLVVEEYPGNAYTKKARKYLKRISSFNN
jgi:TolA-binding protein